MIAKGRWFLAGRVIASVLLSISSFPAPAQDFSPSQTIEAFFNAIKQNDTNTAFQMLAADTNLVRANLRGRLPLHVAASKGGVEIVRELLNRGADVDAAGDTPETMGHRLTALEAAIWYGHSNVCGLLLEAGANPDIQSVSDGSALHYAFAYRRPEMAGWLLDYGADPFLKKKNPYNQATPLEAAITQGDGKLVPRMLGQDRLSPLGAKSRTGFSRAKVKSLEDTSALLLAERGPILLSAAARRGELEAVQALLMAGVPAAANDESGEPLLRGFALATAEAAKTRPAALEQWRQMRTMLDGVPLDGNPQFRTTLRSQEAEQASKVEASDAARRRQILDLLVKNGAEYDAFAATALGDIERVGHLTTADKNVNDVRDVSGQTPLHWAVLSDQLPLTSFWLEAGTSPSATNSAGQTALHLAASKGMAAHIKVLLAAQVSTSLRDTNGWTPLDAAVHAKQTESIRLLLTEKTAVSRPERGISISLHEAAAAGNLAALAALTETAPNLAARDELGLTPLQVAVLRGHLAAAALLVDKGAEVQVRDPDGNTLMHSILLQGQRLNVHDRPPTNWLARMGSDPRKETYLKYLTVGPNEQGPNPLLQTASFLLACGIDAAMTNHAGQTAVHLATDEEVTQRLFLFDDDQAALLKLLGSGGGNMDEADANGDTALHRAGQDTDVDRVAGLLASGASINATNHQGRTPLHRFVERIWAWDQGDGSGQPLQLLLKHKPDVNARDNEGLAPFHVLAAADTSFRSEATRALLDAGADPNLRDKHGRTPIHVFLSGEWPWSEASECIEMLVQAGADLSATDDQGRTPLHYLAALGASNQSAMFSFRKSGETFVAAKVNFDARDHSGDTSLHVAGRGETSGVFDWLVKQGANLDATNNAGETPRLLAARTGNRLGRFGFNAETDIYQAAREGKLDPIVALLKADPQLLNQTNRLGQTPLRVAVLARRTNVVEFLEQQGAHWDVISAVMAARPEKLRVIVAEMPTAATTAFAGRSLLHLAAAIGSVEITRILLEAGANLEATDAWGFSPLGEAMRSRRNDLADYLRQRGASENIFDGVYCRELPVVKALLAENNSLAVATNGNGIAVVEIAAENDDAEMLKVLFANGASPSFTNEHDGRTPLHAAAAHNCTNTAELLIGRGAKPDAADQSGFTPLHLAAIQGSAEVAALLLRHKADPNIRTAFPSVTQSARPSPQMPFPNYLAGFTALHLAALNGRPNLIPLLLEARADVNATNALGRTALDLAAGSPGLLPEMMGLNRGLSRTPERIFIEPAVRTNLLGSQFERQKAAASLLERNGGKRSRAGQAMAGPPWR